MRKILVVMFLFSVILVQAKDEGMWELTQLPKDLLKSRYNFEPTEQWEKHLMLSSVRFDNGGSGSFVSSKGLVLTNHHVAANTLAKLSTSERDIYNNGYLAKDYEQELKAPDLTLSQLTEIRDVTERVNSKVTSEMTDAEALRARLEMISEIQRENTSGNHRGDVVTLFNGGIYHLYIYRKYTDIRLVFSPEFGIAFFGGDPDNFEFPRFDLDMALFRVYENGQPLETQDFLKVQTQGTQPGELVFVSGHPGNTSRAQTVAAFEFNRDHLLPYRLELLRRREIMLQQYSQLNEEHARQAKDKLFSVQNSRKVFLGHQGGLLDPVPMEKKKTQEKDFRKLIDGIGDQSAEKAFLEIENAQAAAAKFFVPYQILEVAHGFNSELFWMARALVRLAYENEKPNSERLPEYSDSARAGLERRLLSPAPLFKELERFQLEDSLTFLTEKLARTPYSNTLASALGGRSPKGRALELSSKTRIYEIETRKSLLAGGRSAIEASQDPMIQLALAVDQDSRKARSDFEIQVRSVEEKAYAKIAKARFKIYGSQLYPDATFTLRLSFGIVEGWQEGDKNIAPYTTLGGAFEHEKTHKAQFPWQLPPSWHAAKDALNLSTPYNFSASADIIGGNSGSPVVNRQGELVGLIFDGNIHSTVGNYFYDERVNRSVSVDIRAMLESLSKIYSAEALAQEMGR